MAVLVAALLTFPTRTSMAAKGVSRAQVAEAEIVAKQALSFYFKGQFKIAAELYHQAFLINKTSPDYLYGAARAEHKVGMLEEAARDYRQVLALFKPGEGLHTKAGFHLKVAEKALSALTEKRAQEARAAEALKATKAAEALKVTKPAPAPVDDEDKLPPLAPPVVEKAPPTVVQSSDGVGWKKPTSIVLASIGVLGMVGGGVMLAGALEQQAGLDEKRLNANQKDDKFFQTTDYNHKDALETQKDINAKNAMAGIVGAAGVVSAGVGVWLWLTAPQIPAVAIAPGRVEIAWRF